MSDLTDVNSKTFEFYQHINTNSDSGRENFSLKWSNVYMEEIWVSPILEKDERKSKAKTSKKRMVVSVSVPAYYKVWNYHTKN